MSQNAVKRKQEDSPDERDPKAAKPSPAEESNEGSNAKFDVSSFNPCLDDTVVIEDDDLEDYEIFLRETGSDKEGSTKLGSKDAPACDKKTKRKGEVPFPESIANVLMSYPQAWRWNGPLSQKIYWAFKLTPYIVNPQFILNPRKYENRIEEILQSSQKWKSVAMKLLSWLDIFEKCESLPNVLGNERQARKILKTFKANVDKHAMRLSRTAPPEFMKSIIQMFRNWILQMDIDLKWQKFAKIAFLKYIDLLITVFYHVMGAPKVSYPTHLKAEVFCSPSVKRKLCVIPDFALSRLNDTYYHPKLVVVGEVQPFKYHSYLTHRGHRPKPPDQSADETSPRVCDAEEKSAHSKESADNNERTDNDSDPMNEKTSWNPDSNEDSDGSMRPLNEKENWKVRSFLPQLFAEMIAAIHSNGGQPTTESGNFNNFMYGMAVNGLKLRFATLSIRDKAKEEKVPSLQSIYKATTRCDVFLTQEFNLFKKEHVFMFFQVLFCLTTNA